MWILYSDICLVDKSFYNAAPPPLKRFVQLHSEQMSRASRSASKGNCSVSQFCSASSYYLLPLWYISTYPKSAPLLPVSHNPPHQPTLFIWALSFTSSVIKPMLLLFTHSWPDCCACPCGCLAFLCLDFAVWAPISPCFVITVCLCGCIWSWSYA